jgi:RHS repeat-associated protein
MQFYYHTRLARVGDAPDGSERERGGEVRVHAVRADDDPRRHRERPLRAIGGRKSVDVHGTAVDEETGLYFYRARSYGPSAGRFLQRDPLRYKDGPCCYEYARSGPPVRVDPEGARSVQVTGGWIRHQKQKSKYHLYVAKLTFGIDERRGKDSEGNPLWIRQIAVVSVWVEKDGSTIYYTYMVTEYFRLNPNHTGHAIAPDKHDPWEIYIPKQWKGRYDSIRIVVWGHLSVGTVTDPSGEKNKHTNRNHVVASSDWLSNPNEISDHYKPAVDLLRDNTKRWKRTQFNEDPSYGSYTYYYEFRWARGSGKPCGEVRGEAFGSHELKRNKKFPFQTGTTTPPPSDGLARPSSGTAPGSSRD